MFLDRGGVLHHTRFLSEQYAVAWLLETGSYCAVDCFVMISGYVGVQAKYRVSNLAELWLRVLWYTVLITVVFAIFFPDRMTWVDWIRACLPVTTNRYWFFTAYVAMYPFIPLLNMAVKKIDATVLRNCLFALLFLFSGIQTIFNRNIERWGINEGYSTLWFLVMYLVGAYVSVHGLFQSVRPIRALLGYLVALAVTWSSKVGIEAAVYLAVHKKLEVDRLIFYISPTVVIMALCLLLAFSRMQLGGRVVKMVKFLSPLAFSVYLVHTEPLIWDNFFKDAFSHYAALPLLGMFALVLVSVAGIFTIGMCVDMPREALFKKLEEVVNR